MTNDLAEATSVGVSHTDDVAARTSPPACWPCNHSLESRPQAQTRNTVWCRMLT